jgi:hypothetical protein
MVLTLPSDEAIKWPELNSHDAAGAPLPTNRTGGAGFDTGGAALSRSNSRNGGYASSVAATSTTELYPAAAHDPYAVPPLPQFNPNQPYRDDPNAFYDPYGGPIPPTFDHAAAGEAIPMTQLAGRRSPGPGAAYGYGQEVAAPSFGYADGRAASPAPAAGGYGDRARSPGPGMAMGRASPAPGAMGGGYGYGQH